MRAALALSMLLVAAGAMAEGPAPEPVPEPVPRPLDASAIGGAAGMRLEGVAGVNVAAGRGNLQANVHQIGLSAGAPARVHQSLDATDADLQRDALAVLGGGAFGAARGVVGINQAAGSANAQLNVLAVGPGADVAFGQVIDNLTLAATRVDAALEPDATAGPGAAPVRQARIEGAAVGAPSGILQLNQTAGAGNASANAIVLQLPGGTP